MENYNLQSSEGSKRRSPAFLGEASSDSGDPNPPKPKQRRHPITDVQRKDLRIHQQALIQENGKWTTNQMLDFFYEKYHRVLNQSTISESLSDTFKHLDEEDRPVNPDAKRQRTSYWPDLEAAVFDWHQQMLKKKVTVSKETLRDIANKIFYELPQYRNVEPPRFSGGWLDSYKARYQVKRYYRKGKSGALDQVGVEAELEGLRKGLKIYKCEDIYTMDETALFWKMSPNDDLTSESKAGGKLEKARITVVLACNVTGTRKLAPWFVGKAQTPRCFDRSGVRVENFPTVWRSNGKAWMTGVIFEEYLRWFDRQMAGRKVCLLVDEFSAHGAVVQFLPRESPEGLANTTILVLPANATSTFQPLNQGITRSWKAHYRRRWLTNMCNKYDKNRDPMKSMNVLQAMRWGIAAWEDDVTPTTIQNCWVQSNILGPKYAPQTEEWKTLVNEDDQIFNNAVAQMEQQIEYLSQQQRFRSAMNIATFIDPVEEIVDDNDNDDDFFESLVECYSTGGVERDHETDEEDVTVAPIEEKEALALLSRLRLYEEQQIDGDGIVISRLNTYEKKIWTRAMT